MCGSASLNPLRFARESADLEDGAWKSRIAERKAAGVNRWHGDEEARRAVHNNRARLRSGVAREAFKLRAELVERSSALTLDRGGMRRAWLRGRENLKKRYRDCQEFRVRATG